MLYYYKREKKRIVLVLFFWIRSSLSREQNQLWRLLTSKPELCKRGTFFFHLITSIYVEAHAQLMKEVLYNTLENIICDPLFILTHTVSAS